MAILIPSKNIYEKQNPKVRDNVIERIEIEAVEVLPNNKYEEPIFNGRVPIKNKQSNTFVGVKSLEMGNYAIYRPTVCCGTKNYSYEYITFDLVVKRQIGNSYATSIFSGQKENGENYIGIAKVVSSEVSKYNVENAVTFEGNYVNEYDYNYSFDTNKILSYNGEKTQVEKQQYNDIVGEKIIFSIDDQNQYPVAGSVVDKLAYIKRDILSKGENIQTKSTVEGGMAIWAIPNFEAVESIENNEYTSLRSPTIEKYEDRYVIKNISVPVSLKTIYYASAFYRPLSDGHTVNDRFSNKYPVKVVEVVQVAQQIEISIYGNTIGIDLTDKTIYINGQTDKKVHSVDGNELMQTSNYSNEKKDFDISQLEVEYRDTVPFRTAIIRLKDGSAKDFDIEIKAINKNSGQIIDRDIKAGTIRSSSIPINENDEVEIMSANSSKHGAIEENYKNTQDLYKNGKETAIIRCSIGDYYDYNSGEKVISVDNSTGKMSFEIYDQVIPMVYGVDGQDHPMSKNKDGSPKVFQVLGSKIYYDGAVWQELSLQEVDKTKSV